MEGFLSACAYDGVQALGMVKEQTPDYILIDFIMPGMDGVATFKRIKEFLPSQKVIMMTGHAVEDLIAEATREGALATLHKTL